MNSSIEQIQDNFDDAEIFFSFNYGRMKNIMKSFYFIGMFDSDVFN